MQKLRARACAILTGSGTVLADNPRMNVRDFDIGRQPLRDVVDSALRTPKDAAILPALIACHHAEPGARAALEQAGAGGGDTAGGGRRGAAGGGGGAPPGFFPPPAARHSGRRRTIQI